MNLRLKAFEVCVFGRGQKYSLHVTMPLASDEPWQLANLRNNSKCLSFSQNIYRLVKYLLSTLVDRIMAIQRYSPPDTRNL